MKRFAPVYALCIAGLLAAVSVSMAGDWAPRKNPLMTEWGKKVTPGNTWREYPRPMMVRKTWVNLNGLWDYAIVDRHKTGEKPPASWQGKILVPFPIESALSGVKKGIWPNRFVWYRRSFKADKTSGKLYLLHFDAVDYQSIVWVNGKEVGRHTGGNTPFRFDITKQLKQGDNEVLLRVYDQTDKRSDDNFQLIGKQTLRPSAIRYTACTGPWQTVWMEAVPAGYIDRLRIDTAHDPATITVKAFVKGKGGARLKVTASFKGKPVATGTGPLTGTTLKIPDAKLWDTTTPNLYDLTIDLLDARDKALDRVGSYAGIRTIGKTRDKKGHLRFTLNGKVIFHWGPLDQGWWPDGLLTPPSDEAMRFDLQFVKDCGFNAIRPHIKVNPRRYYYHCDRLGLLVWQDQVSPPLHKGTWWSKLRAHKRAPDSKKWTEERHAQFIKVFKNMVDELYNHPSIVSWIPFNESWGQHKTIETGNWIMAYDPSRLVNIASGGNFWEVGHIVDGHSYPDPGFAFNGRRFNEKYIKVIGEWGGYKLLPPPENRWNPRHHKYHGYGGTIDTAEAFEKRLKVGLDKLDNLRKKGIAGAVYTQVTDVENEINGLLSYDRKIQKITAERFRELAKMLYE
jgi:beta-galactosidase